MSRDSKKIQKMPGKFSRISIAQIFTSNIVTVMFGILLVYIIFSFVNYKTSNSTERYQVISGPLSRNETFTGLTIRNEKVMQSDAGGYLTYYVREGNKVSANGPVYALSSSKDIGTNIELSTAEKMRIKNQMSSFASNFNSSNYNATYSFKYELEGSILQYATHEAQNNNEGTLDIGNQTISNSVEDGIVLYSKDGYEGKSLNTLSIEDFNRNSYQKQDLKTHDPIKAGDDVYTIITDEKWNLVIPLTDKQAVSLAAYKSLRVKFQKDNHTQTGDFSLLNLDGQKFGVITFEKGLIRYASDRFLDIELLTNTQTGLKVPLTSVLTKDFYVIPSDYLTTNEKNEYGFMKSKTSENGKEVIEFVDATIYGIDQKEKTEELAAGEWPTYLYYVDKNSFQEGDVLVTNTGSDRYTIGKAANLTGVYCINKGYAVFRRINILAQNEEFAIVGENTTYGLVLYDWIVKNYNSLKKEDILY